MSLRQLMAQRRAKLEAWRALGCEPYAYRFEPTHHAVDLLARGADINWIGWDDKTPLDLVDETLQPELAAWLRARGARRADEIQ